MSASDHLSFQLFHGTDVDLSRARKIRPTLQSHESGGFAGQRVAFATTSRQEAEKFGKNVYEVLPDEHSEEYFGGTYYSEKGFKIKR